MNRFATFAASFAIACSVGNAVAQTPSPPQQSASVAPALTAEDLSTFLDGLMPYALERGDVAGGVISVVKDGKVLFAKGYGYADLKNRTPVSPETTLFRPGSTSKLFTWTAVMQLVEQDKLDLDADINQYLDFKIPPRDGKPITLRHLMTHTPGFEDMGRGLLPGNIAEIDLEKYLKRHVPQRIYPQGEIVAYSNYGCGLAGYIVQRVSGEAFDAYVQHHIFTPLRMQHSSFSQPLPAQLAPLMAKGYKSVSDGTAQPYELVNPAPAGSMASSAMDMTRFMIAQLQDGRFENAQILQPATVELMHSRQYTAAPGLNGFDLGFYQENRNGQRIIGHGGDTVVFHSDLHLLLDAQVGFFISLNSAGNDNGAGVIRESVFHAFLDRYFPYSAPRQATVASANADAARIAGWYLISRRNESSLPMLYMLGQVHIAPDADGTMNIAALSTFAGKPMRWHETGPLRYSEVNGQSRLDFVTNEHGDVLYWGTDLIPAVFVWQKVSAMRSLGTFAPLVALSSALMLVALLIWSGGGWLRHRTGQSLALSPQRLRTRLLSRLGAASLLLVVLGWVALVVAISVNEDFILKGTCNPWLVALYVLGVVALLGALAVVINAVKAWMPPQRGGWVRLGETLLGLSALYLAWFIVAFGLVSFSLDY